MSVNNVLLAWIILAVECCLLLALQFSSGIWY